MSFAVPTHGKQVIRDAVRDHSAARAPSAAVPVAVEFSPHDVKIDFPSREAASRALESLLSVKRANFTRGASLLGFRQSISGEDAVVDLSGERSRMTLTAIPNQEAKPEVRAWRNVTHTTGLSAATLTWVGGLVSTMAPKDAPAAEMLQRAGLRSVSGATVPVSDSWLHVSRPPEKPGYVPPQIVLDRAATDMTALFSAMARESVVFGRVFEPSWNPRGGLLFGLDDRGHRFTLDASVGSRAWLEKIVRAVNENSAAPVGVRFEGSGLVYDLHHYNRVPGLKGALLKEVVTRHVTELVIDSAARLGLSTPINHLDMRPSTGPLHFVHGVGNGYLRNCVRDALQSFGGSVKLGGIELPISHEQLPNNLGVTVLSFTPDSPLAHHRTSVLFNRIGNDYLEAPPKEDAINNKGSVVKAARIELKNDIRMRASLPGEIARILEIIPEARGTGMKAAVQSMLSEGGPKVVVRFQGESITLSGFEAARSSDGSVSMVRLHAEIVDRGGQAIRQVTQRLEQLLDLPASKRPTSTVVEHSIVMSDAMLEFVVKEVNDAIRGDRRDVSVTPKMMRLGSCTLSGSRGNVELAFAQGTALGDRTFGLTSTFRADPSGALPYDAIGVIHKYTVTR